MPMAGSGLEIRDTADKEVCAMGAAEAFERCSAGFSTCCIAGFQPAGATMPMAGSGLEIRDTADKEVCATDASRSVRAM